MKLQLAVTGAPATWTRERVGTVEHEVRSGGSGEPVALELDVQDIDDALRHAEVFLARAFATSGGKPRLMPATVEALRRVEELEAKDKGRDNSEWFEKGRAREREEKLRAQLEDKEGETRRLVERVKWLEEQRGQWIGRADEARGIVEELRHAFSERGFHHPRGASARFKKLLASWPEPPADVLAARLVKAQ